MVIFNSKRDFIYKEMKNIKKQILENLRACDTEFHLRDGLVLYIKIVRDCDDLHLQDIALIKDERLMNNITNHLREWTSEQLDDLNLDMHKERLDWEYQREYETIGGKHCNLSY